MTLLDRFALGIGYGFMALSALCVVFVGAAFAVHLWKERKRR